MKQFGKNTKFFLHKTLCKKKIPDGLRFRHPLQKKAEQDHGLVMLTSTKQGNRRYFNKTQKDLCAKPCRRKVSQKSLVVRLTFCPKTTQLRTVIPPTNMAFPQNHLFPQKHLYKATNL